MSLLLALTGGGGGGITGDVSSAQAQTSALVGTVAAPSITGTATQSQAQTSAASGSFALAGVSGDATSSQAQTAALTGTVTAPSVTGTASSSQAQSAALVGSFTPQAITGTATASQAQTSAATGTATSSGITGTATASQAQSSAAAGVVVNVGIQPVHGGGYNFAHDRRLLKARRDKEAHDKLSFAEQLEVIKPQVAKVYQTDKEAASAFVERITALVPSKPVQAISTAIDYPVITVDYQSDNSDDEAIALIMAALL
jgi:hypothetical protein